MANVTNLEKYYEIKEAYNPAIEGRLKNYNASPLIGAGIVRVQMVDNTKFASIENEEAYGELYKVNDDETLPVAKLFGQSALLNKDNEFGRVVVIPNSEINKLMGNIIAGSNIVNTTVTDAESAKAELIDRAYKTLVQQAVTTICKSFYQALAGQLSYLRNTGGSYTNDIAVTNGGSVSKAWSDSTALILDDMIAIDTALRALTEPTSLMRGHTIVSRNIMKYILKNAQIQGLFPWYAQNVSILPSNQVLADPTISEYFGKLTEDDSTYKNESKAFTAFLDDNYIICTAQTQDEPVVDVYIAPTQLDPKYQTTEAGTGFSTHIYDGLTDPNAPSQSVGALTVGIRGRIGVRVRKPKRIYRKKVLNI